MPLINGQKMACAPCIRGHRSTKCTHADERLMVPVRKPGRPLSSCPHPSSRPCTCAAVTAAIPRKQKCHCRSSATAAPTNPVKIESTSDASNGVAAPSPPKAAAVPAFRVQKASSKNGHSRKHSLEPAGFDRIDPAQINFISSYSGPQQGVAMSSGPATPLSDMSLYGTMSLTSTDSSFSEPAMFPIFQYPVSSPIIENAPLPAPPTAGSRSAPAVAKAASPANPGGTLASNGCCGGGGGGGGGANGINHLPTNGGPQPHETTATTTMATLNFASASNNVGQKLTGNGTTCCSTLPDARDTSRDAEPAQGSGIAAPPGSIMMHSLDNQMALPDDVFSYYSEPSIFNYPPQFGSFLQPLQPEQWRQFMASTNPVQPTSHPSLGAGVAAQGQYPATGKPSNVSWTFHQCSCGDGCQCIGCAAHPYNEATQDYVRSAWRTMVEDGQKMQEQHPASRAPNGSAASTPVVAGQADGALSPTAPQTPSDAASGAGEEQTFSASDYFFVSYPFGESCAGETASCPCGDDCRCIGCVIHGNQGQRTKPEKGSL